MEPEVEALKSRIGLLQVAYVVLFGISLVILVATWNMRLPAAMHVAWALSLGGAVAVRLYRTSLVNKYNQKLMGQQAPLR